MLRPNEKSSIVHGVFSFLYKKIDRMPSYVDSILHASIDSIPAVIYLAGLAESTINKDGWFIHHKMLSDEQVYIYAVKDSESSGESSTPLPLQAYTVGDEESKAYAVLQCVIEVSIHTT